jgi:hypothetical protein
VKLYPWQKFLLQHILYNHPGRVVVMMRARPHGKVVTAMHTYRPRHTFYTGPAMPDPREHKRLRRKWAMGKATAAEIQRCRVMDRTVRSRGRM